MPRRLVLAAAALLLAFAQPVAAGDCTGHVVGLRPLNQYNHATGIGFLAVRSGPGSEFMQLGELYLGDEIAVWERSGSWYFVQCMSGRCEAPFWGMAIPMGWVHGRYLDVQGPSCP